MTLPPQEAIAIPAREWRPYPEYRASGVGWLGEVPAHWEVKALKHTVTTCKNGVWGDEPTGGDEDLVCVRVADFDRTRNRVRDSKLTLRSVPSSQQDGKLLEPNDLLIEKSGGGDLQPVGAVVLYDLEARAVCSNFVAKMPVAEDHSSSFLSYLHSVLYSKRINTRSIKQNTGIQNLDSGSYLREKVGLPPLPEQRAIATFLDRETEIIDGLIERREWLISLLREKKTALISHAVTKGLDPDVPMKDSGVEWLGEIPEEWSIVQQKYVWEQCHYGLSESLSGIGDIKVLTMGHIQGGDVLFPPDGSLNSVPYELLLENKDLLFNRTNSFDLVGKVGLFRGSIEDQISFASYLVRLRINDRSTPDYMNYLLNSEGFFRMAQSHALRSVSQANLNPNRYGTLKIPLPSLEEQNDIVNYLDAETAKIDALTAKLGEHIEKLKEYRTAMISAAVTGKIDVRGEVSAPQPGQTGLSQGEITHDYNPSSERVPLDAGTLAFGGA